MGPTGLAARRQRPSGSPRPYELLELCLGLYLLLAHGGIGGSLGEVARTLGDRNDKAGAAAAQGKVARASSLSITIIER